MNADPDFYPLTSAWLEGAATPPEQQLLGEILHSPDSMTEYAALCRTEALLLQSGRKAAARRAALETMLRGKPWTRRVANIWQSRTTRWAAAAAVVALAAWGLWPDHSGDPNRTAKKNRVPALVPGPGDGVANNSGEPLMPVAEDGLEEKLRNYYVPGFAAKGPLDEAAAKLSRGVDLKDGPALAVDVRGEGDAPVHFQSLCPMPAWTIMQMIAMQTGREVKLSGRTAVFSAARKPVPLTGALIRITYVQHLAALFSCENTEEYAVLSALTKESLGSAIVFSAPTSSDSQLDGLIPDVPYTGTPRDVRVLELALAAAANRPPEVELATHALVLPDGVDYPQFLKQMGIATPGAVSGILTAEQMNVLLTDPAKKGVSGRPARTWSAARTMVGFAAPDPATGETLPGTAVQALVSAQRSSSGDVMLHAEVDLVLPMPDETPPGVRTQRMSTTLALRSGESLAMSGAFKMAGDNELVVFVTPTLLDINSPPDASPSVEYDQFGRRIENNLTKMQAQLKVLRNLKGQQLIAAVVELGPTIATIQKLYPEYQAGLAAREEALKSGWGPKHPKIMGLTESIKVMYKQMEEAAEVFRSNLETQIALAKKAQEAANPPTPPAADPDIMDRKEVPYGIPVPGTAGMVQSPYAPGKGAVDVSGLKRGARVACPYTGKHFRVP